MRLIGTIEPGPDVATAEADWLQVIDTHPQLTSVPDRWGVNPFTRAPFLFKANPYTAQLLFEQRQIGLIQWVLDDSSRLVVFADPGFEDVAANVAQDVACRLGWRFAKDDTE